MQITQPAFSGATFTQVHLQNQSKYYPKSDTFGEPGAQLKVSLFIKIALQHS